MTTKNNYRNGAARERRILAKYEKKYPGALVLRSAGSHSKIDCVILVPSERKIFLIQSKPRSMSIKSKEKLERELNSYIFSEHAIKDKHSSHNKAFELEVSVQ